MNELMNLPSPQLLRPTLLHSWLILLQLVLISSILFKNLIGLFQNSTMEFQNSTQSYLKLFTPPALLWYCQKQSPRRCSIKRYSVPATLLKMRLQHRWFSVNFAKFFRIPFFTEHLRRLILFTTQANFLENSF